MTTATVESPELDRLAVQHWPRRTAADLLGLGLVLAVVVALPVAPSDLDRHQLPKETVVHLTTWLAVALSRPAIGRGLSRAAVVALSGFMLLSLVSAVVAMNPWIGLRAAALTGTGIAAFLTAQALGREGLADRLLRWCAVAAAVGVGTALAQAYGWDSVLFAATRAPGGTFGNRNFMAHFAALALPLVVSLSLTTRRHAVGVLAAVVVAALAVGIVLSRSRTAWIGSLIGGAGYLVALVPAWRRQAIPVMRGRVLMLVAAMVIGMGVALFLPNRLEWRSDSPYSETLAGIANHREGSGRGRMIQYRNTLKLASRYPLLGVGPGNWPIRYGEVAPPNDPSWAYNDPVPLNPWPSSDWMALLSERGVAAFAMVLLFGATLAWRGWKGMRSGGSRCVAAGTLGAMLIIASIEGVFDAILLLPAPLLLLAIAGGALLSQADAKERDEELPVLLHSRWGAALAVLLAVIAVRSSLQTAAYIVAGDGRSLARLEWAARLDPVSYPIRIAIANRAPCTSARDDAKAALRLAPGWPAPRLAMRRCGF